MQRALACVRACTRAFEERRRTQKTWHHNTAMATIYPISSAQNPIVENETLFSRFLEHDVQALKNAGFSACDMKEAGCDIRILKSVGFTLKELKHAGFDASAFKGCTDFSVEDLKTEFTPMEMKQAGFDFSALKAAGYNHKELKAAGFHALEFKRDGLTPVDFKNAGFTAQELMNPEISDEIDSKHHREIKQLIDSRVRSGLIFGETWFDRFGFFLPFGSKNSFLNRLRRSPMFRHIFLFDSKFIEDMSRKTLLEEAPSPQATVSDVDSSVNNCAIICALLLSIPAGLISDMSSSDLFDSMVFSGGRGRVMKCGSSHLATSTFDPECMTIFFVDYTDLVTYALISFYTNIFCLLMAVLYYMCRPSESHNISSSLDLLEAFTLEVRRRIRRERYSTGAESEKSPSVAFENPILESEVFFKAKHLAQNEADEQKNQEFYVWYKSQLFSTSVFS